MVLVHGWGMHSGVWEDVVEALLDHCRVTLLDLPGHGYSRSMVAGHALNDLAAALAARRRREPPEWVGRWVGWSRNR